VSQVIDNSAFKGWFENSGRLYEHRIRDLSLLRRLSDAISLDLGVEDAVQYILEILIDELDISNGSIMLLDPDTQFLTLRCVRGQTDECAQVEHHSATRPQGLQLKAGEGVAGTVFKEGRLIMIHDAPNDPRFLKHADQSVNIGSLLCLPLVIRNKVVGVINLSHTETHAFDEGEMHGLTVVANQIAMTLDNNESYQKIRSVNQELENKVLERTEHLEKANIELQQTKSNLIQSERLKALGQMASGVAHDFNNTLAGIIGNTQLLLETIDDKQVQERLRAVEMAAKDGAVTVKRIQEFSRINVNSKLVPLDINQVITDTVTVTSPLWKDQVQKQGRTIDLTTQLGEVTPVAGNAAELREVFTNMILNAIDAMPDGGNIVISSWQQGAQVCLAVSDTGTGMTEETRDKLFDPFYTTKEAANSGLGLSVVFGIIRRHHGTIEVESIENKGSTFIISLPESFDEVPVSEEPEEISEVSSVHILLIDDDPFVRDSVRMMLEHLGHKVSTATNGADGIEMFASESFDLVFTDLGMPGVSGWDVASGVKAINADVPVVLITGWGRELDATDVQAKGVDFVLPKPFELSTTAKILSAALKDGD
jgi:signal transduction histidine kinase/CheY-like chemotaxis protein